jgi:hypothetical protein
VAAPQPRDRPYAGLLYVEHAWLFLDADGETLTTLGAQLGLTGRLSLAEPAQKLIHRILDRPQPQGWDHQVGSTLAVLVSAERRVTWPALSGPIAGKVRLHTAGHVRVALGNTMSYAAGGLTVTVGKNLPPPAACGNGCNVPWCSGPRAAAWPTTCSCRDGPGATTRACGRGAG